MEVTARRAGAFLVGAAALLLTALHPFGGETLETVDIGSRPSGAPAMCPWRDPKRDMRAFFGGAATGYHTETLVLTPFRQEILRRLGPNTRLRVSPPAPGAGTRRDTSVEELALYVHRVYGNAKKPLGSVLVRRTAGRYGAIEVVLGVGRDGRVAGARLQRHREPPGTANVLASPAWLGAFRGKTARSPWRVGGDLLPVPGEASESAGAVVGAARSLLIEFDAATKGTG